MIQNTIMGNTQDSYKYSQLINKSGAILISNVESSENEYIITDIYNNKYCNEKPLIVGGVYNINFTELTLNNEIIKTIVESTLFPTKILKNVIFKKIRKYNGFNFFKTKNANCLINLNDKTWKPLDKSSGKSYSEIEIYNYCVSAGYYNCRSIISVTENKQATILVTSINDEYITDSCRRKYYNNENNIILGVYKIKYQRKLSWNCGKEVIERNITNCELSPVNTMYLKFIKTVPSENGSYHILETSDGKKFINFKNSKWIPDFELIYIVKFYNDKFHKDILAISDIQLTK